MSLIQQGYPVSVDSTSFRGLFFTTCLACFLFYSTYCATLTSVLALEIIDPPVDNLKEVYDLDYKMLVLEGTVYEDFFRRGQRPEAKRLWQDRIKNDRSSFIQSMVLQFTTFHCESFLCLTAYPNFSF